MRLAVTSLSVIIAFTGIQYNNLLATAVVQAGLLPGLGLKSISKAVLSYLAYVPAVVTCITNFTCHTHSLQYPLTMHMHAMAWTMCRWLHETTASLIAVPSTIHSLSASWTQLFSGALSPQPVCLAALSKHNWSRWRRLCCVCL